MIEQGEYPKRILVGYDGSEGADDAVALAEVFCRAGAEYALLVNVAPDAGPLPAAYRLLGYEESPEWRDFFRRAESGLSVETGVRTYVGGSAAKVLTEVAESEGFDLVVVGSPHRGAIGRTLIGSVARGLLHGSAVATVCAPRGYASLPGPALRRIGVAYDGSGEADAAVAAAEALADATGAALDLITVGDPPRPVPTPFAGPLPPVIVDPEEVNRAGVESIEGRREVHGTVLFGPVPNRLADAAAADDLLVLGSRGYGPVARVMLGSVSTGLIHSAPCPVLVVPRPRSAKRSSVLSTSSVAAGSTSAPTSIRYQA